VQRAPGFPCALIASGVKPSQITRAHCAAGSRSHTLNWHAWKGEGVPNVRIFSPLWHFPLSRKRFMVASDFADGRRKSIINIKGLAAS
jgi:hypothetical protein